jgi:hypothetical protein
MVTNSIGSIGYRVDDTPVGKGSKFTFVHPHVLDDGTSVMTKRQSTPDSLRSCVTAMDPDTLELTLRPELSADCYPLTDVLYAQVPKDYPVEQKVEGYESLALLAWSINSTVLLPYTESVMLIQVGSIPSLSTPLITALNSVTCGGETLLITLPIVWQVSATLTRSALALSSLGFILIIASLLFLLYHRNHPLYRSTAPAFLAVSLIGIICFLIACVVLTQPFPSNNTCTALNSVLQLGFTLLFAPLFLKSFRLWRIFGRRKLKVVKISNGKSINDGGGGGVALCACVLMLCSYLLRLSDSDPSPVAVWMVR